MGFQYISNLPSPEEIKKQFPISPAAEVLKTERDQAIKSVLTGKSDKFLVIIGPCSADNEESVSDYVSRLVKVQEKNKRPSDHHSQNLYQQAKDHRRRIQRNASPA